jgi:hypothetical protein
MQINRDRGRSRHAPVHPWKLRIMHRLNALAIAMISRLIAPLRAWRYVKYYYMSLVCLCALEAFCSGGAASIPNEQLP